MSRFLFSGLSAFMVVAVLGTPVRAASAITAPVTGHAPEAVPVISSGMAGDTVTVTVSFSDADNDDEVGSQIQWYRNGVALSGAAGRDLALSQSGIGGDHLTVRVTPKTNPAITDPAEGDPAMSKIERVGSRLLGKFLRPDTTLRSWVEANNHCLSAGARLATKDELQELFVDATSAETVPSGKMNSEMCDVHGWPLSGKCGGKKNAYWSSTPGSRDYYDVYLQDGKASSNDDSTTSYTTCVL